MRDMTTPIVELKAVSKQFELQGERIEALRDANLRVRKGEFVCLIGASGCGKSTLLRIVAGFEQTTRGDALMWGKPIDGPAPDRGMVFQDYGLFPWLTVRSNIGFGPAARGRPSAEIRDTVERFMGLVGLQRFAEAYPHQLSGGMKQRVAIARVLANDAELSVMFVTHSIEEAIFLADRVVVMSPGPGRIESEMTIDLPRPRDVSAPDFNDIRRELARKLHSNLARKAA